MMKSIIAFLSFAFVAAVMVATCARSPKPLTVTAVHVPGRAVPSIVVAPGHARPNEPVRVDYRLNNNSDSLVTVRQVITADDIIEPLDPEWGQGTAKPGETITVARVTMRPDTVGTQALTARFITARDTLEAAPVVLVVSMESGAAVLDSLRAVVEANPDSVQAGDPIQVSYKLANPAGQPVEVLSIQTDSDAPFTRDNPAWVASTVQPNSEAVVMQRQVTRDEPGTWTFSAGFSTSVGFLNARPKIVKIAARTGDATLDTGRVTGLILVSPNPVQEDEPYVIDYQLLNTTGKPVTVTMVLTDAGVFTPDSSAWATNVAQAGQTTTILELRGTGQAPGSRNKTASFYTDAGLFNAGPVLMVEGDTLGADEY